jgi:ATP-dependent Clp protease ATP-binding subunit ClpA
MRSNIQTIRQRRFDAASSASQDLKSRLERRVVGQSNVIKQIVPYVEMFQAGLSPENRPVGVFLLLGPTGTGKTKTVEALAEMLHGSDKAMVRVDCGEFQMEHEVAKLIGAPPGYLGHRETTPMLTQAKLSAATSEQCNLSIILFDEIEKAAPSLARLLLGVLDKATLRLGDNNTVNFEKTIIFLTSNLGAESMARQLKPWFGFEAIAQPNGEEDGQDTEERLRRIGMAAVRRKFSPEFVNRLDSVLTYRPLSSEVLATILDIQLDDLQQHVNRRLGARSFRISYTKAAKQFLLRQGTSIEYGARELKRILLRAVTQPIAALVAAGKVSAGARVSVDLDKEGKALRFSTLNHSAQLLQRLREQQGEDEDLDLLEPDEEAA